VQDLRDNMDLFGLSRVSKILDEHPRVRVSARANTCNADHCPLFCSFEAFLLENVLGLKRKHRKDLDAALDVFRAAGYVPLLFLVQIMCALRDRERARMSLNHACKVVLEKVMVTSQHGLAQKRARLYVAGIRMDSLSRHVTLDDLFPETLQHEVSCLKLISVSVAGCAAELDLFDCINSILFQSCR
jgi:hypothetical protein